MLKEMIHFVVGRFETINSFFYFTFHLLEREILEIFHAKKLSGLKSYLEIFFLNNSISNSSCFILFLEMLKNFLALLMESKIKIQCWDTLIRVIGRLKGTIVISFELFIFLFISWKKFHVEIVRVVDKATIKTAQPRIVPMDRVHNKIIN